MRVLMLNYEYPPIGGGASPVTRALAEQLAVGGHDVDVVTMRYGRLPPLETFGRLRVFRVPALRRSPVRAVTVEMLSYLAAALPITLALAEPGRYDLAHAHFILPTGVLATALRRARSLPFVVTAHGSDVPGYNPDRFMRGHRVLAPAWRAVVGQASAIISPSAYLRDRIRAVADVPVEIIPYGFDAPPARQQPKQRRILFVSRLFPRKGAHHFLDALAGIDRAGWDVIVAGDGPELEPLRVQAQRLGLTVDFRGFLKGPPLEELYATSAIFVLPSLQDNFPVVLLEALSHGCAIITTGISGMPEVVGDAGLLTLPGDVAALRDAIVRLMADDTLRATLSEQARAKVKTFAWEHVLARHLALYERVVSTSYSPVPIEHNTRS
jgi:glycosyltransferase involved in cell wall biosynthesis